MKYNSPVDGTFLHRPNRFIAQVLVNGREETVHVKNTGRCRELLVPGCTVYLEPADSPQRKTRFSLVAVQKGDRLINMDSAAPNKVVWEALDSGLVLPGFPGPARELRREVSFGASRLDLTARWGAHTSLMEVKGVTLEENGAVYFPDAPTLRGIKHIQELARGVSQGYSAHIIFVVQMEGVAFFSPNDKTHPAFGEALRLAARQGVHVHAWDCRVTPGTLDLGRPVEVRL